MQLSYKPNVHNRPRQIFRLRLDRVTLIHNRTRRRVPSTIRIKLLGLFGNAAVFGRWKDARSDARTFVEYGIEGGFVVLHGNILRPSIAGASTGIDLRWKRKLYDSADPAVVSTIRRDDDRYGADMTTEIPLTETLGLVASSGYTHVDSSVANFDYYDWDAAIALAYRF